MPYVTHGDQALRGTARDFAYSFLRHLRDPFLEFWDFGGGSIFTDRSYFSGCAAGSEIASGDSNPYERDYVLTSNLLLFMTATFLVGMYFLPVAVVSGGGMKQVTTLR